MKKWFYIAWIILSFTSCKKDVGFTIEGKITGLNNPTIYLGTILSENGDSIHMDTIQVEKGGRFSMQGYSDKLSPVIVYMEDKGVWATLWVKNNDRISISGDARYPELIIAKGNEENDLLAQFKTENKTLLTTFRDLADKQKNRKVNPDSTNTESKKSEVNAKMANINHQIKEKAEDFVTKYPNTIAALVLIQDYLIDTQDISKIQGYLSKVSGELVGSVLYKKLSDMCRQIKQADIGSQATDFTIRDMNNDTIRLSGFKGKYLLLNFAASWCDICKNECEELVQLRKKIRKDELEMLTISLDANSQDWENVIREYNLTWPQVIDNQGWGSEIVSLYNITSVPASILLDKNGVIIGKDLPTDSITGIIGNK